MRNEFQRHNSICFDALLYAKLKLKALWIGAICARLAKLGEFHSRETPNLFTNKRINFMLLCCEMIEELSLRVNQWTGCDGRNVIKVKGNWRQSRGVEWNLVNGLVFKYFGYRFEGDVRLSCQDLWLIYCGTNWMYFECLKFGLVLKFELPKLTLK